MTEQFALCPLTAADIPAALALSTEAAWNQLSTDWELLLDLAPEDCLGIKVNGRLVSTATMISHGRDLSWIGMVLTTASHRGQGLASHLLQELLRRADERGIRSVKLDATDLGRPLYEKLGFRTEQAVARWSCERPIIAESPDLGIVSARETRLDARAFGVDRTPLLQRLARDNDAISLGSSYLISRPGRLCRYLGPCVVECASDARALATAAFAKYTGPWYWDILSGNPEAEQLARGFGFAPARRLLRMVRGEDLRGNERHVYALAGFELG